MSKNNNAYIQRIASLYALEDKRGQQNILCEICEAYSPILEVCKRKIPEYDHAYFTHLYQLTIYKCLSSYDPGRSSFSTWVYRPLSNIISYYYRENSLTHRNPKIEIVHIDLDTIPQDEDNTMINDLRRILEPMEFILVIERYWHGKGKRCIMRMHNLTLTQFNDTLANALQKVEEYQKG